MCRSFLLGMLVLAVLADGVHCRHGASLETDKPRRIGCVSKSKSGKDRPNSQQLEPAPAKPKASPSATSQTGGVAKGGLRSLGRAGKGKGVREVVGDASDARKLFDQLRGSNPVTEVKPGVFTARGNNGGNVTLRETSKSGPPTVDVHGIEKGVRKIKFVDH